MLLAVLEARAGISLAEQEVYLNVAGGYKVNDPSADLAAASALVSAQMDIAMPLHTVFCGEIGLSGDIRPVPHLATRLKEAAKLGFTQVVCPVPAKDIDGAPLPVIHITHVKELPQWVSHGFCDAQKG